MEDSPNSAGETIDAIRCCKLARERGVAGPLEAVSAYTMKHPPRQFADYTAREMLEAFINNGTDARYEASPADVAQAASTSIPRPSAKPARMAKA